MTKRIICAFAAAVAVAAFAATAARASSTMLVGLNDEANTLYGDPTTAFPLLDQLHNQVIRVNLYWGGTRYAVANSRPTTDATDPSDPAYDWTIYDRLVRYAAQHDEAVMFSILFTPSWANGGKARTQPPTNFQDLADFAHAAMTRYSGYWTPPAWQRDPANASTGTTLPRVSLWTAWNEPNNPVFLTPQYVHVGKTWVIQSAVNYAKICNAVYTGIKSVEKFPGAGPIPGVQVACGVTAPRGNNQPTSTRPSVSPVAFLRACKRYGLKTFDVWAHHPYYDKPTETPAFRPSKKSTAIELGNIDVLLGELSRLYGPKHLWISEYGYQTRPQHKTFGVTWTQQAAYLRQAYTIAHKNPRIDMFLWFLLKDDTKVSGWQSGLLTARGQKKPSFNVFASLPRFLASPILEQLARGTG